ncbi:hypothetical protein AAEX28_01395 [Lentisphaerota bacterium WC36G]|nr:hypothetical protein LJT99_04280 [Lentisphaerae bacterium WC36]
MVQEQFEQYLKNKKLNFTHERQEMFNVIHQKFLKQNFTVKDIENSLKFINSSTVYRNLKIFLDANIIECVHDFNCPHSLNSKTKYYRLKSQNVNEKVRYEIIANNSKKIVIEENILLNQLIKKICNDNLLESKNITVSIKIN